MRVYTKNAFIDENRTVGMHEKYRVTNCSIHLHEFIEIIYIADGEAIQMIDGVEYRVKRGDMLFINVGATHSYSSDAGFEHIELFFSPKMVEEGAITPENAIAMLALSCFDDMRGVSSGGVVSFSGKDRVEIEFILDAIQRERKRTDASSQIIESFVNIILAKMLRVASGEDVALASDIWEELRDYIDKHPEEQITLSTLSAKAFYNPSYFSRAFKRKFGCSPTEYIRSRKIERAMLLLESERISVEDIIYKVGFSDRSSFYHAFSKKTGMTPIEYREKTKKQADK